MNRTIPAALVLYLLCAAPCAAQDRAVPSPEQFLGHPVGADKKLIPWDRVSGYFRKLAEVSDRVRVEDIGLTSEGRKMILAVVARPDTLRDLEKHRQEQRRIADPRLIRDEAEKKRLAESSKIVVMISFSIHASEVAGTQTSLELAHYLATSNAPDVRDIVDKSIVLLVPSANPDGTDIVADWYTKSLGKPWEGGGLPWLYHKYAGHDNNRDWFMLNLAETRNLTRVLYQQWFPTVVLDVHQMGSTGPRQFVPPYFGPINPNIHPMIHQSVGMMGAHMALDLARHGKKGVVHSAIFDLWWSGNFSGEPRQHNMVSVLSETASSRYATPVFLERDQLKGGQRGLPEYAPANNFSDPWPGGWWRQRDAIEYQLIVCKSLLSNAARFRDRFQANYIHIGEDQIKKGREEAPFAWLVPPDQHDMGSALHMLRILHDTAIEVHRADEPFTAAGAKYPAGTFILYASQPYRAHLKDMMDIQKYPKRMTAGGQPERPYDVTGWTLPLQMGVNYHTIARPFEAKATKLDAIPRPQVTIPEVKPDEWFVIRPTTNDDHRLINRLRKRGFSVTLVACEGGQPSGDTLIPGTDELKKALPGLLDGLAVELTLSRSVSPKPNSTPAPRLALYQPWTASMDEGWTRLVLEQFEFPYATLHNDGVRAGKLRDRFDCIILPSVSAKSIVEGQTKKATDPKYAGGIGGDGVKALQEFVKAGGTLVCIDDSCNLPIRRFGIPVRNALTDETTGEPLEAKSFFCPGSIVGVTLDTKHPVGWGRPPQLSAYFAKSQAFDVPRGKDGATVVARYAEKDVLQSGFLLGEQHLAGKAAVVDVTYGDGHIILFGFRVQNRAQPHGTYRLLFNAIQSSTLGRR